jgi:hypothetical protein
MHREYVRNELKDDQTHEQSPSPMSPRSGFVQQADAPNRCPALQFRECWIIRTLDSQPAPVSSSGR